MGRGARSDFVGWLSIADNSNRHGERPQGVYCACRSGLNYSVLTIGDEKADKSCPEQCRRSLH